MADNQIPKVLIVDDKASSATMISLALKTEGLKCITAPGGREGLALAQSEEPDLILLDIVMPDIQGWEVIRLLKLDARTRYIPVIMISALGEPHQVAKGLDLGAEDYLRKPFSNEELVARVRSVLRKSSRRPPLDPLTGLPGKHLIYEETHRRLKRRNRHFAFIYVDITNLRFINHYYGIARGDQVIKAVSGLLSAIIRPDQEFLGYIGEDDFVVLSIPSRSQEVFSALASGFNQEIERLCPDLEKDVRRSSDREVKISMAVVTNEHRQFNGPLQLRNIALEVLSGARSMPGHACVHLKDYHL